MCLIIALLFNISVGIKKKKWGYIRTFMPKGIPWALAPLVMPIETISLLSKPFSLTVRLVANMTVGHIMLKIIAGFIVGLGVLGAVPLLFDSCIIVFELFMKFFKSHSVAIFHLSDVQKQLLDFREPFFFCSFSKLFIKFDFF